MIQEFHQKSPKGLNIFVTSTPSLVVQRFKIYEQMVNGQISEAMTLTGSCKGIDRETVWKRYHVIFTTPQILGHDLDMANVPKSMIKCIVMDDVNKAVGENLRVKIIKTIQNSNRNIRLVGLCQIPGNKETNVINLMKGLRFTHLECRDDNSPDYHQYMKKCEVQEVIVPPPSSNILERYNKVMLPYKEILLNNGIIQSIDQYVASEWLLKRRLIYISSKTNINQNVVKSFDILVKMVVGYHKMHRQGLRSVLFYFQRDAVRMVVAEISELNDLLVDMEEMLGDYPDVENLITNGTTEINKKYKFGHEKFKVLGNELLKHFGNT